MRKKRHHTRITVTPLSAGLWAYLFFRDMSASFYMFVLASVLHEAGHIIAVRLCSRNIESVSIEPFGVSITDSPGLCPYRKSVLISLAGAGTNLIAFIICEVYLMLSSSVNGNIEFFALVNAMLALTNLMPVDGLDGGDVLSVLLTMYSDNDRKERFLRVMSGVGLFLLWVVSVYFLVISEGNLSLLALCGRLFMGIIKQSERHI